MSDSLVRVSRRVEWEPTGRRPEHADARHAPWAEFTARLGLHSQTTRLVDSACVVRQGRTRQGSHPLWRPFPGTWARSVAEALLQTTIRAPKASDFQAGLFRTLGHRASGPERPAILRGLNSPPHVEALLAPLARILANACGNTGDQLPSHILERMGAAICDTQAGVPSARRLGAQLAFKDFDGSRDSAIHTKQAYDYWQDQPGSIHKSRQDLSRIPACRKESGNRRGLDRHLCQETSVLSRTRIASSHRHNISASEIPSNILFNFASSEYFMQSRKDNKCRLLCSRLPHGRSIREKHFKQILTIPSR
ncbi:hypothetical protein Bca4012_103072 [Brassica carinata]